MSAKRIRYVCPRCGSTNLSFTCDIHWDEDRQVFVYGSILEEAYCTCGDIITPREEVISNDESDTD